MGNDSPKDKIADRWMFFFTYPFIAFLAVHIGNENSFSQLLRIPSYYSDLFLALCCSFALGLYTRRLCVWLEQKFSWIEEPKRRLMAQLILGVILPSGLILGMEAIYLSLLNVKLKESSIFYLELPIIIILCLLINLIYIVLLKNYQTTELQKSLETREDYKENFVVQAGKSFLSIPRDEVAYFKIQNKLTFLITKNGQSYIYDFPFKSIIDGLPPEEFFQLNRQVIAKRTNIKNSIQTETRRLKIELSPSMDEQVFVAKTKASDFINWFQSV